MNYLNNPNTKFAIILALCLAAFTSCREEEVEDEGLPLPVISLQETSAAKNFEYIGSIEGVESVEIRPQVDGILEEIYVDEGEFVEKGQPLFKINSQPYMEEYKNAMANVNLEKAKLENKKRR